MRERRTGRKPACRSMSLAVRDWPSSVRSASSTHTACAGGVTASKDSRAVASAAPAVLVGAARGAVVAAGGLQASSSDSLSAASSSSSAPARHPIPAKGKPAASPAAAVRAVSHLSCAMSRVDASSGDALARRHERRRHVSSRRGIGEGPKMQPAIACAQCCGGVPARSSSPRRESTRRVSSAAASAVARDPCCAGWDCSAPSAASCSDMPSGGGVNDRAWNSDPRAPAAASPPPAPPGGSKAVLTALSGGAKS
eukprot:scaffold12676_cov112-Isochrysis_galbana.AAC.2